MIKLIVGLGNPGQQYCRTRHNVGFWFVDELAEEKNADWLQDKKFQAQIATVKIQQEKVVLLKPQTFMNRSGFSVLAYIKYFQIDVSEILIIHDELDFLPGIVKLKKNGGHAGHNGLRDIIAQLGTNEFKRLRIGIGRPIGRQQVADFVLSAPSCDDREKIEFAYRSVLSRISVLFEKEIDQAMNELQA